MHGMRAGDTHHLPRWRRPPWLHEEGFECPQLGRDPPPRANVSHQRRPHASRLRVHRRIHNMLAGFRAREQSVLARELDELRKPLGQRAVLVVVVEHERGYAQLVRVLGFAPLYVARRYTPVHHRIVRAE
eukprot:1187027-Rhodomonas_salina.1